MFSARTAFHQAASVRKKTAFFKMLPNCTSAVENLFGKPVVDDALPAGKSRAELPAATETAISKV